MDAVQASVIVPTHNRRDSLLRLLDSLLAQTLGSRQYEIIVVSDGSSDGTVAAVRELAARHPQIRLLEQSRGGPAAARNRAARAAQGELLAFTDDDCQAEKDWLERLLAPLHDSRIVGVQGRTISTPAEMTPLTHQMVLERKSDVVPTCNAAYRKSAFQQLLGFDERFPYPHNEDVDLAWRLETLGTIAYAPDAVIVHPPRRESFAKKAAWVRYLESEFLLYAKHPAKYRQRRQSTPWRTIYWHMFVVWQLGNLKSSLRFFRGQFKPVYFGQAVGLVLARGWNLVRYFPRFRAAEVASRAAVAPPAPAVAARLPGGAAHPADLPSK
jgi:GT2 family glycosyltransferase